MSEKTTRPTAVQGTASRVVQLLSRYIAMAAIAAFAWISGTDPTGETATAIGLGATEIAVAVVGLSGLLIDQVIHRVTRGGLLKDRPERQI